MEAWRSVIAHKSLSRLVCEHGVAPVILLIHPETAVNPTLLQWVSVVSRWIALHILTMLFRTEKYISNLDYDESWYATLGKKEWERHWQAEKSERKGLNDSVYGTTLLNTWFWMVGRHFFLIFYIWIAMKYFQVLTLLQLHNRI